MQLRLKTRRRPYLGILGFLGKLSIPIIIWHNHSYAMIREGMIKRDIPQIGVNPLAPNFEKLAEAFGCPGEKAKNESQFRDLLTNAFNHSGPSLIVVSENDPWVIGQIN